MKLKFLALLSFVVPLIGCNQNGNIVNVASFVDTTGKTPCSDKIQELINNNPHRTLYFRDGTYLLDHQILTPGDPDKSVDLQLSNYAVLKASDNYQVERTGEKEKWQDGYLYMVSLGGLDRENDVTKVGSVYSLTGGVIDGSGRAAGIEIAGGRETRVQNVSMKGVQVGLRIAPGVNSGSSDADIRDMSIICNDDKDSYGLILEGSDNTASNIRIGHVTHGVYTSGGSNLLSYVHPLHNGNCLAKNYNESVGFEITNFTELNNCYSDNFRIGFKVDQWPAFLTDCIAWWFNPGGSLREQYAICKSADDFNCSVNNFVYGVRERKEAETPVNPQFMIGNSNKGGNGKIHNIRARNRNLIQDAYNNAGTYLPIPDTLLDTYLVEGEEIGFYY